MAAAVLDAHALLAFFRGEDAGVPVKELLHKAATADRPLHMTEVNYADFKSRFKISLADAFAAALSKEKKAELVTGIPEFKALEKEIKINWLQ
jgi:PIN domain nuclease of toxin-antitoxin system